MRTLCALSVVLLVTGLADADIFSSRRNAVVTAIESAAPGVVSVNVDLSAIVDTAPRSLGRKFWDFYDAPGENRSNESNIQSAGSGFICDKAGYIITNYHVVCGAEKALSVTLPDGRRFDARMVGVDPRTDLALLKITASSLSELTMGDSDTLYIGEWVIAIGNPMGSYMTDPKPSVSVGVVSATDRHIRQGAEDGDCLYQGMIQTDAAINPGNSGGPLVNSDGEVIGVNTMILSMSGGSMGLGFAIPINRVMKVVKDLKTNRRRRDPWAGFEVENVTNLQSEFRQSHGILAEAGCVVVRLQTNTPAFQAGLRTGDVIVGLDDTSIATTQDLDFAMWDRFIGQRVKLHVQRGKEKLTFAFKLVELKNE